jgi:hypothetical protein
MRSLRASNRETRSTRRDGRPPRPGHGPPPLDLLNERVFQLRALAESPDVQSTRAEFLPLVLLTPTCSNALRARAGRALSTLGCAGRI